MFQAISIPDCAAERLHPGYAGLVTHPVPFPRPRFSLREGPKCCGVPCILEAGASRAGVPKLELGNQHNGTVHILN